jgi:putative CRISPR-associated protein (TIGR02619 family)
MPRTRLISTVGTSILNNIRKPHDSQNGASAETHDLLRKYLNDQNWIMLGKTLAKIDPHARICGAEINSLHEAINKKKMILEHVHFLVSDTTDGRNVGSLLKSYIDAHGITDLKTSTVHPIEDLQDANPKHFKIYGLRNLVRTLGEIVHRYGAESILIDATGGYKAQIAIAVVFGQALEIPVLYKHEHFSEIVDFPPLPITFDYATLGRNALLLKAFEDGATLTLDEISELDDKVRVLLEEIKVEDTEVFALGAVGQVFLTGFRLRSQRNLQLRPVDVSQKQPPSFREDHYPSGFKEYVQKVCDEVPWIKTAHSLPYHGQAAIRGKVNAGIGFYVYEGKLVGLFTDNTGFGGRFEILTEATSTDQLTFAADQLNQMYYR